MKKIMLDLETMGLKPGYVVLSIGAVVFDEDGPTDPDPVVDNEFHCRLDTSVQHAVGLRTDPDTALWWMSQSAGAQQSLIEMDPLSVQPSLGAFADWLTEVVDEEENSDGTLKVEVWGNGANFDPPMLREVFEAVGVKCPWAWYNERCFRTEKKQMTALIKRYGGGEPKLPAFDGIKHDALSDAHHQAVVYAALHRQLDEAVAGTH